MVIKYTMSSTSDCYITDSSSTDSSSTDSCSTEKSERWADRHVALVFAAACVAIFVGVMWAYILLEHFINGSITREIWITMGISTLIGVIIVLVAMCTDCRDNRKMVESNSSEASASSSSLNINDI